MGGQCHRVCVRGISATYLGSLLVHCGPVPAQFLLLISFPGGLLLCMPSLVAWCVWLMLQVIKGNSDDVIFRCSQLCIFSPSGTVSTKNCYLQMSMWLCSKTPRSLWAAMTKCQRLASLSTTKTRFQRVEV